MLVGAFEIERGRPCQIEPLLQNESVGRARIEPDVENIVDLVPLRRIVDQAGQEAFLRPALEPGVGAFGAEGGEDSLDQRGRES